MQFSPLTGLSGPSMPNNHCCVIWKKDDSLIAIVNSIKDLQIQLSKGIQIDKSRTKRFTDAQHYKL